MQKSEAFGVDIIVITSKQITELTAVIFSAKDFLPCFVYRSTISVSVYSGREYAQSGNSFQRHKVCAMEEQQFAHFYLVIANRKLIAC